VNPSCRTTVKLLERSSTFGTVQCVTFCNLSLPEKMPTDHIHARRPCGILLTCINGQAWMSTIWRLASCTRQRTPSSAVGKIPRQWLLAGVGARRAGQLGRRHSRQSADEKLRRRRPQSAGRRGERRHGRVIDHGGTISASQ